MIEADEVCVRLTPSLWLWLAVSRLTRQVLGFAFGQRDAATLAVCWSDVPEDYRRRTVFTDRYPVYARFFAGLTRNERPEHRACDKGSGLTSIVESLNTKWRSRQAGLVRRACGTSRRIEDDLTERFYLLVEQHNRRCEKRWQSILTATQNGQ